MELFFEQLLNGVAMGAIYSLITLGLALVYGVLRILHVAHAAVYTAGAYVGLYVFTVTDSLMAAVGMAMAVCALLGVAVEKFVYTPLLKYPPFVPLIGSIAGFLGLEEIFRIIGGPYIISFPAELPFGGFTARGVIVSPAIIAIYAVSAVVL
ncbi:MAG: branched-chain amino acid ABC transporter permease, partial [Synergistaceae bacterium]|nr:branched-chain amino acid ABC transporter permease [Synergistaceae bacterium]